MAGRIGESSFVGVIDRRRILVAVLAVPGFIWFLIAIILVLVILGWVFGRRRV